MKLNTAFVLLFAGINLIIFNFEDKIYIKIYKLLSITTILIGLITLFANAGFYFFDIDNFLINDVFHEINPGRMSPTSSICAVLIGISFLRFKSNNTVFLKLSNHTSKIASIISLISLISYILIIPQENKIPIFKTMSLHTSILFFVISLELMFRRKKSIFNKLFFSTYLGSKNFRSALPLIIIYPIVISNLLLLGFAENWISADAGILIYTVIIIPVAILYVSRFALNINFIEKERKILDMKLEAHNLNLNNFNKALDLIATMAVTNKQGVITYVNDSFCEISQYSKKELIGSTFKIIHSGYHEPAFFKKMQETMKTGEIWSGQIKNKAKDNSFYWVDAKIIPFKNRKKEITGYIHIIQETSTETKPNNMIS
ncbi:hypothetical protein BTO16_06190 [Polaribacter glomeratus]|uniref:PAS domain-containing protein n=2 Tax=Polaribacter glomeratus TaxID=102 RepID=A0A2S7WX85_9FLAO|nr:hypothetical protein BTO16_06190 [Polaribacter glomeratus]